MNNTVNNIVFPENTIFYESNMVNNDLQFLCRNSKQGRHHADPVSLPRCSAVCKQANLKNIHGRPLGVPGRGSAADAVEVVAAAVEVVADAIEAVAGGARPGQLKKGSIAARAQ